MRNISDQVCGEYKNTHFMFSNFLPEYLPFKRMEKYGRARQATHDNMAQAHCMLDT
jgi:hypothetical protein